MLRNSPKYYANKEEHVVPEEIYLNLGPDKRESRIKFPKWPNLLENTKLPNKS